MGFLGKKASPLALYFGCYFGWHHRWLISFIKDRCQGSLGVEWRYWQGSPVTVLNQYQNYLYFATFHKTLFPTLSAAQYEYGNIIFNIEWLQIKDLLIIINQSQRCIIVHVTHAITTILFKIRYLKSYNNTYCALQLANCNILATIVHINKINHKLFCITNSTVTTEMCTAVQQCSGTWCTDNSDISYFLGNLQKVRRYSQFSTSHW